MAIYLDANVLWRWLHFNEPERLAISIVAHQLGQEVLVPEIAVIEAEEELRRRINDELENLWSAERELQRILDDEVEIVLEPGIEIDCHLERWRGRLEGFASIQSLRGEDAIDAFRREVGGRRPARPREKGRHGGGGRDTAVWLTILRDHIRRGEPSHLLSADRKAFADQGGNLHPDLSREVSNAGGAAIDFYPGAGRLIETLGESAPVDDLDAQRVSDAAREAVETAASNSKELTYAVWGEIRTDMRHRVRVEESDLIEISGLRRYEQGADGVLLLNTRWRLVARLFWQDSATDQPSMWASYEGVVALGDVQLLVEERAEGLGAIEVLGAQFKSTKRLWVGPGDSLVTVEESG